MKVEQIYTGCLAQGAYYIESENEAAIVDPLREIKPYIEKADRAGVKIKYVFETHFHADFVSGHVELSKATGAPIVYGPNASTEFDAIIAKDGDVFKIGKITITVLHTPGHTLESTTYLLKDEQGKDYCIFSGDTLFIGDVGRPDLAQNGKLKSEDLAGMLYDSLHSKIAGLSNDVIVYPAHGAGSACGKNMSKETSDTLGNQKKFNYALRENLSRDAFISELLDGLPPPPSYFPENVRLNRTGYENLSLVLERGEQPLTPDQFEQVANDTGALLLDTRKAADFAKSFIPNSINIGIDGNFAPWVGTLVTDIKQPILIIADEGRETEVVTRLARVGYDNSRGFLKGGMREWSGAGKETDRIITITASEFSSKLNNNNSAVVDIRKPSEFAAGHIKNARNLPLDSISENMQFLNKNQTTYMHCEGGYRSMIAASILKSRGYENIVEVTGGYNAIVRAGIAVETGNH